MKKGFQANITFIFNVLSENLITIVTMWFFLEVKNIVNLRETYFFRIRVFKIISCHKHLLYKYTNKQFNTLTKCLSGLGNRKPFTGKRDCPKNYFLEWNEA